MNKAISFASENFACAHPAFIEAITNCNRLPAASYGNDDHTARARKAIEQAMGRECDVFFTFNGTGANNFALAGIVKPYSAVFCSDVAHIFVDESTAPEAFLNCRLYPVASENGKIIIPKLEEKLRRFGDVHHPQPTAITLSQPTEYGTVYSRDELQAIRKLADKFEMAIHIDGARFFNAAVAMDASLYEMTAETDVLTLGGTKNGMVFGEAVVFFNKWRSPANRYHLKRSMQLASKMRFISAQFEAMFKDELWKQLAAHANSMAQHFAASATDLPGLSITRPVDTNAVFMQMPIEICQRMQQFASFYVWNERTEETRFMFSFNNMKAEIDTFINNLRQAVKA